MELSDHTHLRPIGRDSRRGQSLLDQAVRIDAGGERAHAAIDAKVLRPTRGGRGDGRCRRSGGILPPAVRSLAVHRLHIGGSSCNGRCSREPGPGDLGARRKVSGVDRPHGGPQARGRPHLARQTRQRRADVHRARLRVRAGRIARRLCPTGPLLGRARVPRYVHQSRLHQHGERSPRGAHAGAVGRRRREGCAGGCLGSARR